MAAADPHKRPQHDPLPSSSAATLKLATCYCLEELRAKACLPEVLEALLSLQEKAFAATSRSLGGRQRAHSNLKTCKLPQSNREKNT